MIGCADADEGLCSEGMPVIALFIEEAFHNQKIQLIGIQHGEKAGGIVYDQRHFMIRGRDILGDGIRQHIVADGFRGTDPQMKAFPAGDGLLHFLIIILDGAGILLQDLAGIGLGKTFSVILEQAGLILGLQCLDLLGHGWLCQVELCRSGMIIHGVTYSQKSFQLCFHGSSSFLIKYWNQVILKDNFILSLCRAIMQA